MELWELVLKMRVDDVAGNGLVRCSSPRYMLPFDSRNEVPSQLDDVACNIYQALQRGCKPQSIAGG